MNPQEYPESNNGGNTERKRGSAVAIEEQKEDNEEPASKFRKRSAFAIYDQAEEAKESVGNSASLSAL